MVGFSFFKALKRINGHTEVDDQARRRRERSEHFTILSLPPLYGKLCVELKRMRYIWTAQVRMNLNPNIVFLGLPTGYCLGD